LRAGEEIPLEVENAPRLIAAVEAIRRKATGTTEPPLRDAAVTASLCFARSSAPANGAQPKLLDVQVKL
jgi:hypothetical protein